MIRLRFHALTLSFRTFVVLHLPLENAEAKPIRHLLHIALSFNGGNPDLISMLINFGMNVNESFYPEAPLKYVYFYFGMKYRLLGPSRFRTICFLAFRMCFFFPVPFSGLLSDPFKGCW